MTPLLRLVAPAFALGLAAVVSSYSSGVSVNYDGTGSPLTNANCSNCHSGGPYATEATLELRDAAGAAVAAYRPGATYTLVVDATLAQAAAGRGVQAVALDGADAQAGAWGDAPDGMRLYERAGVTYLDHRRRLADTAVLVEWTAPAAGTGPVDFYAVVNAVNGNSSTSGDVADRVALSIPEAAAPPPSYSVLPLTALRGVDAATGVADSLGLLVEVEGLVYGRDTELGVSNFNLLAADNAAGVTVLNYSDTLGYAAAEGDRLRVRGRLEQIGGLTYVAADSVAVLASGEALPAPDTVDALSEALEGRLVTLRVAGVADTLAWRDAPDETYDLPLLLHGGDTVIAQIARGLDAWGAPRPTGLERLVSVTGVVRQWDPDAPHFQGHYLLPRAVDDFEVEPLVGLDALVGVPGLAVTHDGEVITVRAGQPLGDLRLVDLAGRTLAVERIATAGGRLSARMAWPVGPPAGAYVVQACLTDGRCAARVLAR